MWPGMSAQRTILVTPATNRAAGHSSATRLHRGTLVDAGAKLGDRADLLTAIAMQTKSDEIAVSPALFIQARLCRLEVESHQQPINP